MPDVGRGTYPWTGGSESPRFGNRGKREIGERAANEKNATSHVARGREAAREFFFSLQKGALCGATAGRRIDQREGFRRGGRKKDARVGPGFSYCPEKLSFVNLYPEKKRGARHRRGGAARRGARARAPFAAGRCRLSLVIGFSRENICTCTKGEGRARAAGTKGTSVGDECRKQPTRNNAMSPSWTNASYTGGLD